MNTKILKKVIFILVIMLNILFAITEINNEIFAYTKNINMTNKKVGDVIDIVAIDWNDGSSKKLGIVHEDNWYCIEPDSIQTSMPTPYTVNKIYKIENTVQAYIANQKSTLYGKGSHVMRKNTQVAYWMSLGYSKEKITGKFKDKFLEYNEKETFNNVVDSGKKIYDNARNWSVAIKNVKNVEISSTTNTEQAEVTLKNFTRNAILNIYDKVLVDDVDKTSSVKNGKITIERPTNRSNN